jgi:hypothetical protein
MLTIYRQLTLTTKDLIYDRFARRIYTSIPGIAPSGNSIIPLDPFTATLGQPISVGSEPGKLAISDNGQFLYVALDGAAGIRRLDLASQTPGPQFSLGNNANFFSTSYLYCVGDLKFTAEDPLALAVARKFPDVSPPNDRRGDI